MNNGLPSVRREHRVPLLRRERRRFDARERLDERGAVLTRKCLELDCRGANPAASPPWSLFEQICACEAEDEQGYLLDAAREVLDQIEHRLLRPVNVLEDEEERLQIGELRRPGLRCPGDLRRRPLTADGIEDARCEREEIRDRLVAATRPELLGRSVDRVVIRDSRSNPDHLRNSPVRDSLAVRQRSTRENGRPLDSGDELPRQARLADSGTSVDGDEMGSPVTSGPGERVVEHLELLLTPDERRRNNERAPALVRDRQRPPRLEARWESPCLLDADPLGADVAARQTLDGRAEQDLTRRGSLLQPRSRVECDPGDERGVVLVGEDLARLDPDAHFEA